MRDILDDSKKQHPIGGKRWLFGYCLPGVGLLLLGFVTAALAPADAISLGGFLCFFTLGVTLIIEGTKKLRLGNKKESCGKNDQ